MWVRRVGRYGPVDITLERSGKRGGEAEKRSPASWSKLVDSDVWPNAQAEVNQQLSREALGMCSPMNSR